MEENCQLTAVKSGNCNFHSTSGDLQKSVNRAAGVEVEVWGAERSSEEHFTQKVSARLTRSSYFFSLYM